MAKLFLPDNTVLINFALLHRMDLLAELIRGQGAWCVSVARECRASSEYPRLEDLRDAAAIFGAPLIPDAAELVDTRLLRESVASPGDPSTKHLGEAETVAVVSRRQLDGFFMTDDGDAQALAVHHGIRVVTTWDLLRLAYRTEKISLTVLTGYLATLRSEKRGRPPGVTDQAALIEWLG